MSGVYTSPTTGLDLYAKPADSTAVTWGGDTIDATEKTFGGNPLGIYEFGTDDKVTYVIYEKAGADADPGDQIRGMFPADQVVSTAVVAMPVFGQVPSGRIQTNLYAFQGESRTFRIPVFMADGKTPVDLSGLSLHAVVEQQDETHVETVAVSITGADNNEVEFTVTPLSTDRNKATLRYAVRQDANPKIVKLQGPLDILVAAEDPV